MFGSSFNKVFGGFLLLRLLLFGVKHNPMQKENMGNNNSNLDSDLQEEVGYWKSQLTQDFDLNGRFDFLGCSDVQFAWLLQRMCDLVKQVPSSLFLDALVQCLKDVHDDAGTRRSTILGFLQCCADVDSKFGERLNLNMRVTLARRFGALLHLKVDDFFTSNEKSRTWTSLFPSPYLATQCLTAECWQKWTHMKNVRVEDRLSNWERELERFLQCFLDHRRANFLNEKHPHPDLMNLLAAGAAVFPGKMLRPRVEHCLSRFMKVPGGSCNKKWFEARCAYVSYVKAYMHADSMDEKGGTTSLEFLWMTFEAKWRSFIIQEEKQKQTERDQQTNLPLFRFYKKQKEDEAKSRRKYEERVAQERKERETHLDLRVKFLIPPQGVLLTGPKNYYQVSVHKIYNCPNYGISFRIAYNDQKRTNNMDEEVWVLLQAVVQRSNQAAQETRRVHFVLVWISLKGRLGSRLRFLLRQSVVPCENTNESHCYDPEWVPLQLKTERPGCPDVCNQDKLTIPTKTKRKRASASSYYRCAVIPLADREGRRLHIECCDEDREPLEEEEKELKKTLMALMDDKRGEIQVSTPLLGFTQFGTDFLSSLQMLGFELLEQQKCESHVWYKWVDNKYDETYRTTSILKREEDISQDPARWELPRVDIKAAAEQLEVVKAILERKHLEHDLPDVKIAFNHGMSLGCRWLSHSKMWKVNLPLGYSCRRHYHWFGDDQSGLRSFFVLCKHLRIDWETQENYVCDLNDLCTFLLLLHSLYGNDVSLVLK